jgi:hypothetical protein
MKKSTSHLMILIFITLSFQSFIPSSWAQSPQKISYQAVIRNSIDKLVVNQKVSMKISILMGSESGTAVYTETQKPTTNANGLVSIEIGAGTTSDNFSAIDWANGKYFIKTETDPAGGTSYSIAGISELLSVPYAFYAQTSGTGTDADTDPTNEIQTISKTGNILTLSRSGGSVNVDDADADLMNEIQILSISGSNLSLSKGGGTVPLPSSSGSADNWGTQTAVTDATLSGNGTTATPLKIGQQSATNGQALKWDGTTWKPGKVDADSTNEIQTISLNGNNLILSKNGGSITLPTTGGGTGGDQWGIQTAVTDETLGGNGTPTSPLSIAQQEATNGQVLKWNGSSWLPGNDSAGFSLPYAAGTDDSNSLYAFDIGSLNRSGIRGVSTYTDEGIRYGVTGEASGTQGRGVFGVAFSTSGVTCGVKGTSHSSEGTGIDGRAASATGINYGVCGTTLSSQGFGVFGQSPGIGVKGSGYTGVSGEGSIIGVHGTSSTTSGQSFGVYGSSFSEQGFGVYGICSSGTAVFGESSNTGVKGTGDYGVVGEGIQYGVLGNSNSLTGSGVKGVNPNGFGVFGSGSIAIQGVAASGGVAGAFIGPVTVNGNVGIGINNPEYLLDVAGAVNISSGIASGAGLRCNGTEALWFDGNYFSWGYGALYNLFWSPVSVGCFPEDGYKLSVSGNAIKTGSNTWDTWSDIRLKDVHGNYEKGLKEINLLHPIKFSYKAGNAQNLPSDKNYVGFIAQEVQKIFPEAVNEGKDGYLTLDVNSINVAVINAIKELKAENDQLKAENELLKSKNEQIDTRLSKLEKIIGASAMK